MKTIKILHIGDMQNGFTRQNGNLYVNGAQDIIAPMNAFLRQVKDSFFDYTLIILDTHFAEEYFLSEEGKQFPIHCEYGTTDWELSIDISGLHNPFYVMKNQYTMWGEKKEVDISFPNPQRKTAHDTLFHMVDDPHEPTRIIPRDDFITSLNPDDNSVSIEVTMIGVASDYCIRYAMEGWLARGARVIIIYDLTKGIEKETPQVLAEDQYQHYEYGRIRSISSDEYLRELARQ